MAAPTSPHHGAGAARSGVAGTIVAAVAFFDGVFIGLPIAVLAASFRPSLVYILATLAVVTLVIGCCRWVDRRWDDWFSGNGTRIEKRLETMRSSRLMAHPVAWIQRGSNRWYALAAAVATRFSSPPSPASSPASPSGSAASFSGPWRTPSRTWRCGRSSGSHSARRSEPSRACLRFGIVKRTFAESSTSVILVDVGEDTLIARLRERARDPADGRTRNRPGSTRASAVCP